MSKRYVMGDLHGNHKGLVQCLERSGFNKEDDVLIQLGDIVDGWTETYEVVEELLTIKNLITIKGNHDEWFYQWLTRGEHPIAWLHGGHNTLASYCKHADREYRPFAGGYVSDLTFIDIPESHREFFRKQSLYVVDEDNNLFVHGGFDRHHPITDTIHNGIETLIWDRDLWYAAMSFGKIDKDDPEYPSRRKFRMYDNFKEVFIGHTSTVNWGTTEPMNAANIWNLDTGGGWKGKVTIMDIDTKEYWQSDYSHELYSGERGRM